MKDLLGNFQVSAERTDDGQVRLVFDDIKDETEPSCDTCEHDYEDEDEEEVELTVGQKLVGYNFNPAQRSDVTILKALAAAMIDKLSEIQVTSQRQTALRDNAIQEIISAQMWAVKAATYQE